MIRSGRFSSSSSLCTGTLLKVAASRKPLLLALPMTLTSPSSLMLQGSIGDENFELVKNFVSEFIGIASMDDGRVRIGVLTFSNSVRLYAYLNSYSTARSLQEVVKNISYDSSLTYTAAGLQAANNNIFVSRRGDRSDVPNVAILIADGISNVEQANTIPQANLLKDTGAKIIAVGITTSNRTKDELDKLASLPLSDHRIDVDDFTKLKGLSNSILSVTCAETLPPPPTTTPAPTTTTTTSTTTPTTITTTATTTISPTTTSTTTSTSTTTAATTQMTNPTTKEEVTEEPEYTGTGFGIIVVTPGGMTTEVCLDNPLDIAFIVDASSSVGNNHFRLVVDYIKSVLSTTDIDGGKVRAAVLTYSTDTTVHINLNDFKTKKEIYGALDGIPYVPGWTNAAEAFQTLRTKVLTARTGDRDKVKNVALLITDGRSNINKDRVVLEANEVKKAGTHVLAVGVGLASLEEVDNVVTSPANENRFTVASYEDLRGLGEVLFPFLCQDRRVTGNGGDGATGVPGSRGTTPEAPKSSGSTTQEMSTTGGTQGGRYSGTTDQNMTLSTTIPLVVNTRQLQCHAWCQDNQEETPAVNISDLVRELTLPKAMLSKQQRAKGSAFDDSPVAKSVGTIVFLLCSTPFFIFVGWDILDLARYLSSTRKSFFPMLR